MSAKATDSAVPVVHELPSYVNAWKGPAIIVLFENISQSFDKGARC